MEIGEKFKLDENADRGFSIDLDPRFENETAESSVWIVLYEGEKLVSCKSGHIEQLKILLLFSK